MMQDNTNCIIELMGRDDLVLCCLVEVSVNEFRVLCFYDRISRKWEWATLTATSMFGGIIVLWKRSINLVTLITGSRHSNYLVSSPNYPEV